MNGVLLFAAFTGTAALIAGALSFRFHRAYLGLARELSRQAASFGTKREALEKRARDATEESRRLQALTLSGARLSADEPVFSGRPSPRDAEELARLVRGLTFVDDVVVTDSSGLALSRETTARSASFAALGAALAEMQISLTGVGLPALEVSVEMADATHVVGRPLSGRGEGATLLVATTSQRASTLVLDAVAHAAARADSPAVASVLGAPWTSSDAHEAAARGFGGALVAVFDRALRDGHRGLVLLDGDTVLLSGSHSGPEAEVRSKVARALARLASRASSSLRTGSVHIELTLASGYLASWSTCAPATPHAVVTFGEANLGSPRRLSLLVGAIRRGLAGWGETVISGDAA